MDGESLSAAEYLLAELNHKINSPLAAIRNALYLAACRTSDPELHRYLQLANSEITSIADTLRAARQSRSRKTPALRMAAIRRAAA
jgi:two-component sensor histidine kinase